MIEQKSGPVPANLQPPGVWLAVIVKPAKHPYLPGERPCQLVVGIDMPISLEVTEEPAVLPIDRMGFPPRHEVFKQDLTIVSCKTTALAFWKETWIEARHSRGSFFCLSKAVLGVSPQPRFRSAGGIPDTSMLMRIVPEPPFAVVQGLRNRSRGIVPIFAAQRTLTLRTPNKPRKWDCPPRAPHHSEGPGLTSRCSSGGKGGRLWLGSRRYQNATLL
jgi:hypothetical protein